MLICLSGVQIAWELLETTPRFNSFLINLIMLKWYSKSSFIWWYIDTCTCLFFCSKEPSANWRAELYPFHCRFYRCNRMMDGLNRFPVKAVICALIFYGFRNLIVIYLYYVFELMFTRNGKLTKELVLLHDVHSWNIFVNYVIFKILQLTIEKWSLYNLINNIILQCPVTCGKGMKHRQVWCQLNDEQLRDDFCNLNDRPGSVTPCELPECASWQVGPWGAVST